MSGSNPGLGQVLGVGGGWWRGWAKLFLGAAQPTDLRRRTPVLGKSL